MKTAIITLLVAAASAYKLPRGVANGVYSVHLNSRGHEIHQRVDQPGAALVGGGSSRRSTPQFSSVLPRQDGNMANAFCGCDVALSSTDNDGAVEALKAQVATGDDGKVHDTGSTAYYSISEGTVAFICPFDDHFGANEYGVDEALVNIRQFCGDDTAGTYQSIGSFSPYGDLVGDIGIMSSSITDFCGAAEASASHGCP